MTQFRLLILLMLCSICYLARAAEERMPIIAYMGIPDWRTSDQDFRVLSECGFTVSLYPYSSLDLLVKACRFADKYGVKVLAQCPEMTASPQKAAQTLKKEKGFYGYFIQDEPKVDELARLQQHIGQLKAVDSTHCFYINLLPHQNNDPSRARKYASYLKTAAATSCQQLSFDFYPIRTNGIHPSWYHNLEMIRQESLASGKPFWGFVLSVPHDVPFTPDTYYPTPTLSSLRLQVYSNLAYGAQGIQYFTYWNPGKNEGYNYHDAPISREGQKTKTYFLVQAMNQELAKVAQLFYGAKVTAVNHMNTIPIGATKLATLPPNIKKLKAVGRTGVSYKNSHLSRRTASRLATYYFSDSRNDIKHEDRQDIRWSGQPDVPVRTLQVTTAAVSRGAGTH